MGLALATVVLALSFAFRPFAFASTPSSFGATWLIRLMSICDSSRHHSYLIVAQIKDSLWRRRHQKIASNDPVIVKG